MALTYEVDERGEPTGWYGPRKQADLFRKIQPVGIGIITNTESKILKTIRAERKLTMGGKIMYGIGEHGRASLNDASFDKFYPYPAEDSEQRREVRGVFYESPRQIVARGIVEELRLQEILGIDPDPKEATKIIMDDLHDLKVRSVIDLSENSRAKSARQFHYFFGFIYDPEIHGALNPTKEEFSLCEWTEINYDEIFSTLAKYLPEDYCSKTTRAIRRLEKRNISFFSIESLEKFRRYRRHKRSYRGKSRISKSAAAF